MQTKESTIRVESIATLLAENNEISNTSTSNRGLLNFGTSHMITFVHDNRFKNIEFTRDDN